MSDVVIRVEGLGKQYRIGRRERYQTLRDTLTATAAAPVRWLQSLFRPSFQAEPENSSDLFWALKDVSFGVPRGAVVGIIGRNGAGKSTLLKILSRITEPTEGRVEIHGRVGSLLEVGTGFHPELTGRENILLNGAILGMRRSEIVRKFDEIVAFAEVEKFIDTPVKHFSSGMYMRLAFAVAAHLEPEILVIDEVLAVGDAQFQKKCLGKIGDIAKQGRSVLFVSHNMVAVSSLCTRAIRLSEGRVIERGNVPSVVAGYLSDVPRAPAAVSWSDAMNAPRHDSARLQEVAVVAADSRSAFLTLDTAVEVSVTYRNYLDSAMLNVSLVLYTAQQVCVFNAISPPTNRKAGVVRETCRIPAGLLNAGEYRVRILLVRDAGTILLDFPDLVSFEVLETRRNVNWYGDWIGVVRPNLSWSSKSIADQQSAVI